MESEVFLGFCLCLIIQQKGKTLRFFAQIRKFFHKSWQNSLLQRTFADF